MLLISVFCLSCTSPTSEDSEAETCNEQVEICDRSIAQVLFAGTHNSMSSEQEGWLGPNHIYPIPKQLTDGIRALNIDTYWWEEEPYMCHGYCELGAQPLQYATDSIAQFLSEHPQNVLIITFQSTLTAEQTLEPFIASGLATELYTHTTGTEWPTLSTFIENQTRLLLFSNTDGGRIPGYMSQWEHWLDNPYSAQSVADFSCLPDRGETTTASLYNMNHFLTNPIAQPSLAEEANAKQTIEEHLNRCIAETGLHPTQILVDFYSIGSVLEVVRSYNENISLD